LDVSNNHKIRFLKKTLIRPVFHLP